MEENYECPKCGTENYDVTHHGDYEIRACISCDYEEDYYFRKPQTETERNFFADCSNTESLAWQYIGWTGSILNNQTRLPEPTMLTDLKEALEHFKKRWEEILNETK